MNNDRDIPFLFLMMEKALQIVFFLILGARFSVFMIKIIGLKGEWTPNWQLVEVLEIAFETKSLRQLCETNQVARRKLGDSVAVKLQSRLADLASANSIDDVIAGYPRLIDEEIYVLSLSDEYRVAFIQNHPSAPRNGQGALDWKQVRRIKIIEIKKCQ